MKPPSTLLKASRLLLMAATRRRRLLLEPAAQRRGVALVVFSKDRALQLHALLSSQLARTRPQAGTIVLHRSTDDRHASAYADALGELRASGLAVEAVAETDFRADLLRLLSGLRAGRVLLLVDDLLWHRELDWAQLEGADPLRWMVSLRLGPSITHCQPLGRDQRIPELRDSPFPGWLEWDWSRGEGDWRFPTALDGAVFDRRELLWLLERIPFRAPNTLEWSLGQYARHFRRRGLCAQAPKLVNIPLNSVQTEGFSFPAGGDGVGALLEAWEQGWELDPALAENFPRDRTHAILPPRLRRRKGPR